MPKALVEIGGKPILWHVIGIYAAQGFERFLLATGYLGEMVEEFVAETAWPERLEIACVDTGRDTATGGRLARLRERLDDETFWRYATTCNYAVWYAPAVRGVVREERRAQYVEKGTDNAGGAGTIRTQYGTVELVSFTPGG